MWMRKYGKKWIKFVHKEHNNHLIDAFSELNKKIELLIDLFYGTHDWISNDQITEFIKSKNVNDSDCLQMALSRLRSSSYLKMEYRVTTPEGTSSYKDLMDIPYTYYDELTESEVDITTGMIKLWYKVQRTWKK